VHAVILSTVISTLLCAVVVLQWINRSVEIVNVSVCILCCILQVLPHVKHDMHWKLTCLLVNKSHLNMNVINIMSAMLVAVLELHLSLFGKMIMHDDCSVRFVNNSPFHSTVISPFITGVIFNSNCLTVIGCNYSSTRR